MRKIYLLGIAVALTVSAKADYKFMKFSFTDLSTLVVSADGLTVTPEGSDVVILNDASETHRFPAVSLSAMELTDDPAAVGEITLTGDGAVSVFSLSGQSMGLFSSKEKACEVLAPGVYVFRNSNGKSVKIKVER